MSIMSSDGIEEHNYSDILIEKINVKDKHFANEAVLVTNSDNKIMEVLVNQILNVDFVLKIQNEVLKEILPNY